MVSSRQARAKGRILPLTREVADRHAGAIVDVFCRTKLESWREWHAADVMMDLPRKWEFSSLLLNDDSPVGFLIASVYRTNIVHLHQMAVLRECRGTHGGRCLVEYLVQLCGEKGISAITLETPPGTVGAQRLYSSLGFEVIQDAARLRRYLGDKLKAGNGRGYYPMDKEGVKVWRMELRGRNHDR